MAQNATIDDVLAQMCDEIDELPEYDSDDQYASPFACESAKPGNYFMQMTLSPVFADAYHNDQFAETLGTVAHDLIREVDDASVAKSAHDHYRNVIGTARMLMRRWARGGRGEAIAEVEYGYIADELEALQTIHDVTGERFMSMKEADEKGGIDFVTPNNELVQVKTTSKKPTWKDSKSYTKLVWVDENYDIHEIEK